ncbi:GAF and ANTAR domain-containing protein [Modestobacter versicolor]|uniref:Antitermination regulator n=1 Tax=Modestobacter versicolor TaxID=429133 RepID=A0A323VWV6_9ACTN|nr:GAF and ANTAR domain-containing protein [Modestobacter versicolor]MBB3674684.1 GAF domain-containing protein [Modestobacter versicolor]PZA23248.1 antitermination regulator [Modestobacter versicolor]
MGTDQQVRVAGSSRGSLGDVMSQVARQLQEEHGDVEATLRGITRSAVGTIPGAAECGISYVIGRAAVEPRAWTSDLPKDVDSLQSRLHEGPCSDAVWENRVVSVVDVGADGRWPQLAREAPQLGVGSMLCFQLFVEGDDLGAFNVYGREPGAFDDESQETGLMFAGHAAVALASAEHEENPRGGMANRDLIGEAKGIGTERHQLTADQAFAVLIRTSSLTNRKLRDLADELTTTGQLPTA